MALTLLPLLTLLALLTMPVPAAPAPAAAVPPAVAAAAETVESATPWAIARHVWPTDDRAAVTADLDRIAQLGARYVRTDFWWRSVAPSRGGFDTEALDYYDWYVDAAARRGLGVVVILSGPPDWAKALYDTGARTAFADAFGEYAARVAERVGDQVRYYQLWNEPNHVNDWVDHDGDIALFRTGHDGLARYDRSATTIVNLLADGHDSPWCPNWRCDLDYYLANGADPYLDVLGLDHYPGTWSGGSWGGDILDRLFAKGSQYGKPVAVMETGYSTAGCSPAQNSEAGQAEWIRTELPRLRGKLNDPGVTRGVPFAMATWYEFDDLDTGHDNCFGDPIGTIEAHFGVVRTDRTAKPGFTELRTQISRFT